MERREDIEHYHHQKTLPTSTIATPSSKKMKIEQEKHSGNLYANKIILGPMVRVGTLPLRLLALRHGADLVYTEEIIDFKLIKSRRQVNESLKTIDFIDESGTVVLRTCAQERDKVVVQIGTNDPKRAVLAAKMVESDVAAIDVNMGCPKAFSLKGGMGAALLHKPELVKAILVELKQNISIPISCKIRVLPSIEETIELVKMIESSGVDAIAVHGRTKMERSTHPNRVDYIRRIVDEVTSIPIIANGASASVKCFDDIGKFKSESHASSVMVSRAAMKNFTIFDDGNCHVDNGDRTSEPDIDNLIRQYLMLSVLYDNNVLNTKYCVQQILGKLQETERGKLLLGKTSFHRRESFC